MITLINPIHYNRIKLNPTKPRQTAILSEYKDTVSFKAKEEEISKKEYALAKKRLCNEAIERNLLSYKIDDILESLTPKSYRYFDKILDLGEDIQKNQLSDIISYINKPETKVEELDEKFANIQKFQKIFEKLVKDDYKEFERMYPIIVSNNGISNLIKSDILLDSKIGQIRPLQESLELIFDTMKHTLDKKSQNYMKKQGNQVDDIRTSMDSLCLTLDTGSNFNGILSSARILDNATFNEIWYNRKADSEMLYTLLSQMKTSDYKLLYNLVNRSFKIVLTPEGKQKVPVSLEDKVFAINMAGKNRYLINNRKVSVPDDVFLSKSGILDFEKLKDAFLIPTLMYAGVSRNDAVNYLKRYLDFKSRSLENQKSTDFWDTSYLIRIIGNDDIFLKTLVTDATKGEFIRNLHSPSTDYGKINLSNREIFEKNNVDYEKWLKPDIYPKEEIFVSKKGKEKRFTVKMWNRIPQESLFDGNDTTCCTGIGKFHGCAFPKFMMNTAFNTIEVKDENGKVIGMTRLFLAKIRGESKPSLIVENIEINNNISKNYLYDDETKIKYREMVFDYIRDLAKSINKDKNYDMPIYFCSERFKVKNINKGLKKPDYPKNNEILGKLPYEIYINAYGETYYPGIEKLSLSLIDITEKN